MKRNYTILFAALLILFAATARIVNREMHVPNFAPLAALGLFSGAVIKERRLALLVPILGQLFADIFFQLFTQTPGFYDIYSQVFNYGGLAAAAYLGMRMTKPSTVNVLAYTFGASTLFFILSNFGVWLAGWYGRSFDALVHTYKMAIPFFKYTIAGDMAGGVIFFGTYFLIQHALSSKMQKA